MQLAGLVGGFCQGLCCCCILAPGPGMASAASVSALDSEPLFVLSAKRKSLSVYQGLRKEAASEPILVTVSYIESVAPQRRSWG